MYVFSCCSSAMPCSSSCVLAVVAQQCPVLHHTTLPRLPVPSVRPARHSRRPRRVGPPGGRWPWVRLLPQHPQSVRTAAGWDRHHLGVHGRPRTLVPEEIHATDIEQKQVMAHHHATLSMLSMSHHHHNHHHLSLSLTLSHSLSLSLSLSRSLSLSCSLSLSRSLSISS